MRICVYEDRHVRGLEPLTLTRPAADLICGLDTLARKQTRFFLAGSVGHLCRPAMADLIKSHDPLCPVNDASWLRGAPTLLVNARWVPPSRPESGTPNPLVLGPHLGTVKGEIAYAVVDARRLQALSPLTLDGCLDEWTRSLPAHEVGGTLVRRPWELVDLNAEEIARDFEAIADPSSAGFHPTGFALVGPADRLLIDPTAQIDPMVVADTTKGPVVIGPGAVIQAFTRLEGPCGVGAGAMVLGAKVRAGTTIGPQCRVGGEVECSVLLGFSNKYHEGFLGHSYVGEWVNLAAGTHTSDLRCDYRPIAVPIDGEEVPTGRTKVGAVIADHVRTGLGVLLDCGTMVGPFAQVLPGGGFARRAIPGFHRVGPSGAKELKDVERLLATADIVMRRRGRSLSPSLEAVYRSAARLQWSENAVIPLRRPA
jgi:UDP-N-acetylglucosamine diphosphorylase/glucosamine-1-phosphate N-acetyltransferase